jgi:Pvc16 N-terminal domain
LLFNQLHFVDLLAYYNQKKMNLKKIIKSLAAKIKDESSVEVDIANIAALNDGDEFFESRSPIVMSIVNIEEDKTLKNQSVYIKSSNNQTTIDRHIHPTKHLIISLLFSSYNQTLTKYLDGFDKLNEIINFFQQNTSLYVKFSDQSMITYDAYLLAIKADPSQSDEYEKITLETVSLSMDQLHQMWSYLGSRYMPSVLVKMRLISVQGTTTKSKEVINKLQVNLWENDPKDLAGLQESKNSKLETP